MTARMAKQIAEERGYTVDGRYTDVTFDDVTYTGDVDESYTIYLRRDTDVTYLYQGVEMMSLAEQSLRLGFRYGRVESVGHEYKFYPCEHCEEQLEFFLAKFPLLAIKNESDTFRSYNYKANKLATVSATLKDWQGNGCSVSRNIWDGNYAQMRWNKDFFRRIGRY